MNLIKLEAREIDVIIYAGKFYVFAGGSDEETGLMAVGPEPDASAAS